MIVYIAVCFVCLAGNAQNNRITGRVIDSTTLQPLSFATVSVLNNSQTAVKNGISDSLGSFILTGIPAGNYYLAISAVGYKTVVSKELFITETSNIDAGLFIAATESGVLTGVIVTGKRPLVTTSVDGFSYNAADDIVAAGSTADELMRKVPMLSVDQNGNPMLRGSTNIRVFIDDKPSDVYAPTVADALKQIPAADIVRIDVILNPSARYEAEGTDGVINIITRKSRFDAVNGTLSTRIGNIQRNFTPDINIRHGNWILNGNAGVASYQSNNGSVLNRSAISGGIKNSLQQQGEWKNRGRIFYSGLNVIYVFNDLHSVNAGYRYRINRDYNDRSTTSDYYQHDSLATSYIRNTYNTSGNEVHSTYFGYNGKSRNRKEQYSLQAIYFSLHGPDEYDLDQLRDEVTDYREFFRGTTTNAELSLQADYTHTINDSVSWDAGVKSASRRYGSTNRFDVYDFSSGSFEDDPGRFSRFNYQRDIYAVYSDIAARFNSWQARAGIRYEQTVLQMAFKDTSFTIPNYNNLTPSVVLSKTIRQKHVLKWSYGKRISRPLGNLNPAINYIDSFTLQSGNPDLQPEITNRYSMDYSFNGRQLFFMASLFYNSTHNALEGVRLPLGNGIFLNTYQNIGHNDVLGLSLSFNWKWKDKFSLNATIVFRENFLESKTLQQSVNAFNVNGNLRAGYYFNKGYSIEAITFLGLDDYTLQGRRQNWQFYGLTINKKFKGDKITLSLRADNFLSGPHQSLTQTWASPQFKQSVTTRYQNLYAFIGLSWKLGKKEVKAPNVRQDGGE